MADGIKPVYTSGFDLPEEGFAVMQVKEIHFDEVDKGTMCKIKSEIIDHEQVESIGLNIFDNFPLWADFAKARLLGFLVKSTGMNGDKVYPSSYFEDEKVKAKITQKAKDTIFGGTIKHTEGKKGKMANIREYFTQDEVKSQMKEAKSGSDKKSSSKKEKEKPAEETAAGGAEDAWD